MYPSPVRIEAAVFDAGRLAAGTFAGNGNVEVAQEVKIVELEEIRIDGLKGDYAYRKRTAQPVKEAAKATAEAAQEVSNKPGILLKARRISAIGATVAFVNEQASPHYRVFLANTDLDDGEFQQPAR